MKKLLAMLLCLASTASVAQGSTNVCGHADSTWTKAQSPYLVTCDLMVASLTIEPGVKVIATGPYKIEVTGRLTAIGTATDSITFTSADTVASWRGLFFNFSSAPGTLAFCDISKSTNHGVLIDNSDVTIHDCLIHNNSTANAAVAHGGGIYVNNMPIALTNCVIRNNTVGGAYGAGIYSTKPIRLVGCTIRNNSTVSFGGGVFCEDSVEAFSSTITRNAASHDGEAGGGGIYSRKSVRMHDSVLRGNTVSSYENWGGIGKGGAIRTEGMILLERCRVDSNSVSVSGYWGCRDPWGGGLYAGNGLTLLNTIVSDNSVGGCTNYGGGIYVNAGLATILNSTIAYNGTSGLDAAVSTVSVRNSILFFNASPSGGTQIAPTGLDVKFCDVQGGYGAAADSNFNANPSFDTRTSLKIYSISPCIDHGDPGTAYNDACFSPCGDPNDPACMLPSYGEPRNDVGVGGGPGACPSTVPDVVAPVVHVVSPNGGEILAKGTTFPLTWTATDNVGVQSVDLKLSRTGPTGPWELLASGVANSGTYNWFVNGAAAINSAYLRVIARDYAGNADSAMSAAAFTPTLVELFRAVPTDAGVRIEWELSDPAAFQSIALERAAAATGGWEPVTATPVVSGRATSVLDAAAPAGQEQWYRLSGVQRDGRSFTFGPISVKAQEAITAFALSPLSPNPTRGHALVTFEIPVRTYVRLTLVDVQGRKVSMLADGVREPGRYTAALEAGDLRAGIYFVRMQAKGVDLTRRVVMVR